MLETIDLKLKVPKSEYKERMENLEIRLGELQREARELGVPVLLVFEGWDAAGKGTLINELSLALDARGFKVNPTNAPTEEEAMRPFLWRFWLRTPASGRIAIFDRSWYGRVMVGRVEKLVPKKLWQRAFREINDFERQLAEDGTVILKFFLHISQKEQGKRFAKLAADKHTAWKVSKADRKRHRQYEKYLGAIEEMLSRTDLPYAPWIIIPAHDRRIATLTLFETIIASLEKRLLDLRAGVSVSFSDLPPSSGSMLAKTDLSLSLSRKDYKKELKECQGRIHELEHEAYIRRLPVMIAYEGWDAAGKGGNIRRLVQGLDPRGYEVIPIAAPNDIEKSHHYLWRFWQHIPKAGHMTIFDRTWYGRVLVERVEGFCSEAEWQRSYHEINEFEQQLTDFGVVMVKFWIHIDQDEQLRRFKAREKTPWKQWKITDEDWRNREKYDAYYEAVDEMLRRTSTVNAPWTVIPGNCKLYARIHALKTVIKAMEQRL